MALFLVGGDPAPMYRGVAIVGAGHSRFGAFGVSAKRLFADAAEECFASVDRDFERSRVREAWIGTLGFGGGQLGEIAPLLCEHIGLKGMPAHRVENACASSGFAFRNAVIAVRGGEAQIALAGGVGGDSRGSCSRACTR